MIESALQFDVAIITETKSTIRHDQVHLVIWWRRSCTRPSPAFLGSSNFMYAVTKMEQETRLGMARNELKLWMQMQVELTSIFLLLTSVPSLQSVLSKSLIFIWLLCGYKPVASTKLHGICDFSPKQHHCYVWDATAQDPQVSKWHWLLSLDI